MQAIVRRPLRLCGYGIDMSNEHEDRPVDGGYTGFTKQRTCNLHDDCDLADKACIEKRNKLAIHCSIEYCEDCFGC